MHSHDAAEPCGDPAERRNRLAVAVLPLGRVDAGAWGDKLPLSQVGPSVADFHQIACRINAKWVEFLWSRQAKGAGRGGTGATKRQCWTSSRYGEG